MPYKKIIFDLDGTLIDSAPSILSSLQAALEATAIFPNRPLDKSLIGPPLSQIVTEVLGIQQKERTTEIIKRFKEHYDSSGYLSTMAYPGIPEMLTELREKNVDLYIATNKRITPTLKILIHLGWENVFKKVYSLDYFTPAHSDKTSMLSQVRRDLSKDVHDLVYVGDREEDSGAAKQNNMPFLYASWGYGGDIGDVGITDILNTPNNIFKYA